MLEAHLRSIYEEIGAGAIDELVNAFYPKVYSDPNLILFSMRISMTSCINSDYF